MLTEQFVKRYGTEKNGVFFSPLEIVANISIEELREQKFSQRKAEYIVGLGRSIVSGTLNLASIENGTEEDISAQLLPIRELVHGQCKTFNVWAWTEKYVPESRHWDSTCSARYISIR